MNKIILKPTQSKQSREEKLILALSPGQKLVLSAMIELSNLFGDTLYPSQTGWLMKRTGLSRATVHRTMKRLHELKLVHKANRGVKVTCLYSVNPKLRFNYNLRFKLSHVIRAFKWMPLVALAVFPNTLCQTASRRVDAQVKGNSKYNIQQVVFSKKNGTKTGSKTGSKTSLAKISHNSSEILYKGGMRFENLRHYCAYLGWKRKKDRIEMEKNYALKVQGAHNHNVKRKNTVQTLRTIDQGITDCENESQSSKLSSLEKLKNVPVENSSAAQFFAQCAAKAIEQDLLSM